MTEQNALRHYISKAKKAQKKQNLQEMKMLIEEATKILTIGFCYKCNYDDFGYCALRNSDIQEEEKFKKYCFLAVIKEMEDMLNEELRGVKNG